jgi:hypothetical protein
LDQRGLEIDPDKLTPSQLDRIAEHLIQKALAGNPAAVEEATRRLEAGESVTSTYSFSSRIWMALV